MFLTIQEGVFVCVCIQMLIGMLTLDMGITFGYIAGTTFMLCTLIVNM